MEIKYIPVLKLLLESDTWVTSKTIAVSLSVSVRTVKTYILELNSLYPTLVSSSSKGYRINYELARKLLRDTRSGIPQTAHERAVYIILKALNSHQKISEPDLCEELFISYSTFRLLLPKIKEMLDPFDLTLETSSSYLSIHGAEKDIRRFLSNIFHQEYSNNFFNLNLMQDVYPDIDIEFIRKLLTEKLNRHQYFLNDYSMINLVLHITIMLDRINNHYSDSYNVITDMEIREDELKICTEILEELQNHFNLKLRKHEYNDLLYLILSQITYLDCKKISMKELEDIVGKDCMTLVNRMVRYISDYYDINLDDKDFIIRFSLHIKNLLMRSENKHFNKNPMTENIKENCPLIYDNSVAISGIIKEQTGIVINDDEIAYIAFHIGSAMENIMNSQPKISCTVYYPSYYNNNDNFYQKIMQKFGSDLTITSIVTSIDELEDKNLDSCDLLIFTAPAEYITDIQKLEIQPFLTSNNMKLLEEKIRIIKENKKRKEFSNDLQKILSPDLFEHSSEKFTKNELLHYMCNRLVKSGYVKKNFEENVLKRENLSSTGYENFAIPHSMTMDAETTGIFIFLSDTPIQWDENHKVSLIILLFFNKSQRSIFNKIYDSLTIFLTDPVNCQAVRNIYDYESFVEYLSSHVEI